MFTIGILAVAIVRPQAPVRANAAYWFPAAEGVEKWLPRLVGEELFDTWVVDPKPNRLTLETAKSKVKIVPPGVVYSKPNDRWREGTIKFVQGKISPAAWLNQTSKLGETYHYLTTPKTPSFRSLTANIPNGLGAYSGRAVFAETLLCYWSGKPCFYSTDIWRTSYFPEDKQHESWILAMNDFLGPMLSLRLRTRVGHPTSQLYCEPTQIRDCSSFNARAGSRPSASTLTMASNPRHFQKGSSLSLRSCLEG